MFGNRKDRASGLSHVYSTRDRVGPIRRAPGPDHQRQRASSASGSTSSRRNQQRAPSSSSSESSRRHQHSRHPNASNASSRRRSSGPSPSPSRYQRRAQPGRRPHGPRTERKAGKVTARDLEDLRLQQRLAIVADGRLVGPRPNSNDAWNLELATLQRMVIHDLQHRLVSLVAHIQDEQWVDEVTVDIAKTLLDDYCKLLFFGGVAYKCISNCGSNSIMTQAARRPRASPKLEREAALF